MIITKEQFIEMGFECSAENEELLCRCIKRAEYIINALCGGTLEYMANGSNRGFIEQAVAFQADALMKSERNVEIKSCTVGDVSYTAGSERKEFDVEPTVKKLLYAAGYFGAAAEVV